MEKSHNIHLIHGYGFIPFQCDGEWRSGAYLDHFESQVNPVTVVGFYPSNYGTQQVVIDTRDQNHIPLDYINTYADRLSEETVKKIYAEEDRLTKIERARLDALEKEKEQS